MLPVNDVIKLGVIMKIIYGNVILKKIVIAFAPSIFAASYNSYGMFCKIPVVDNIVNGTPIQKLIQIIKIRAIVTSVKK